MNLFLDFLRLINFPLLLLFFFKISPINNIQQRYFMIIHSSSISFELHSRANNYFLWMNFYLSSPESSREHHKNICALLKGTFFTLGDNFFIILFTSQSSARRNKGGRNIVERFINELLVMKYCHMTRRVWANWKIKFFMLH